MLLELALVAAQTGTEMRLMRYPDIHGDTVVFTYAGDLWTSNVNGGLARRLTSYPGNESFPYFSPDGKWIAFTGSYDGNPDVYVMPAEGGEPTRLTYDSGPDFVKGWTPDGSKVAYVSDTDTPGTFSYGLKLISPKGGLPTPTKQLEIFDLSFNPDGKRIVFNRNNSHAFNWRNYRGGTQGRIAFSDLNATDYKEIPSGRENRWHPMWIGDNVFYIGDKNLGTRNLYVWDTKASRETMVTNFSDVDIKWPNSDGKTIIFERNGFLQTYDVATKTVKTLNPRVATDAVAARPKMMKLGGAISSFSISPSGNRIALGARGEIFSVPARTGETRHLGGDSSSNEKNVAWSPDGKTIAFMSDKSGEFRIYTMPQMGGAWTEVATPTGSIIENFTWSPDSEKMAFWSGDRLFVHNLKSGQTDQVFVEPFNGAPVPYDWSPDSKWIAFCKSAPNMFTAIHLYNLEKKTATQVTEGYYSDDNVAFDVNGKYLYFVSKRTINPNFGDFEFNLNTENAQRVYALVLSKDGENPLNRTGDEEPAGNPPPAPGAAPAAETKIDFDGLDKRVIPLPWAPGSYPGIAGLRNGVLTFTNGQWVMFDFNSKASQPLIAGAQAIDLNLARTKFAYIGPGGVVGISDLRPAVEMGAGRVNTANMEFRVDPRAEWKQIFWEAWRWERDKFYDKDMGGVNWQAMGKRYEALLPYVSHRSDLSYVLSQLVHELGTGHSYVQGGDMGDGGANVPTGMLGADYETMNGKIRFKKIFAGLNFEEPRRGPLGDPGVNVNVGDYLLAIDGQEVGADNPGKYLVGKVGRTVKITVNSSPNMQGSRTFTVRPVASEGELRYISWVEDNRALVSKLSGGKIGYMHVPNTAMEGVIEFLKGYYSQSDKQAIIIDERYNGGGFIPTFFVEKLGRTINSGFRQREGQDIAFPPQSLDMPKVMLINEFAGSGGDMLPYLFKKMKLGPLVGNRTWGGLVGITGAAPLVDGGGVTAPEFGIYDPDTGEWIAENKGVDPDIAVDLRPDLVAKGQDPQLQKAIDHLLAEIAKGRKAPKVPTFPILRRGGGG